MTDIVIESKELQRRIGERIKASRTEKKVTIRQIALALDVDPRTVARWQTGESAVSYENLARIAELVGKRPSYFLEDEAA